MANEIDSLEGQSFLEIARKNLEKQWAAFGGPEGTSVTLTDISSLVAAQLTFTWTQNEVPEEQRVLDVMGINPLADLKPHNLDFGNPAIRQFALSWLRQERTRLVILRISTDIIESSPTSNLKPLLALDSPEEIARQIKACNTGIELLKQSNEGLEG